MKSIMIQGTASGAGKTTTCCSVMQDFIKSLDVVVDHIHLQNCVGLGLDSGHDVLFFDGLVTFDAHLGNRRLLLNNESQDFAPRTIALLGLHFLEIAQGIDGFDIVTQLRGAQDLALGALGRCLDGGSFDPFSAADIDFSNDSFGQQVHSGLLSNLGERHCQVLDALIVSHQDFGLLDPLNIHQLRVDTDVVAHLTENTINDSSGAHPLTQ